MVSDPYLWITAACLFAGLAAGQALRAFASLGEGFLRSRRRAPGRLARAIAFLSLGILGFAGLLVFAAKPLAPTMSCAWPWALLVFLAAFLAGFRPLAAGLPIAAASIACLLVIGLALEGWLALRPATKGAAYVVGSFLPYEVGSSSFRGHLELPERDSVPVAQELSLASNSLAVSVEGLRLSGPLRFLSELSAAFSGKGGSGAAPLLYYRVVGIAAPGGISQAFAAPARIRLLDFLLPLTAGGGLEPGGESAESSAPLGLATRTRRTSPAIALVALSPVSFVLNSEDYSINIR